MRILWISPFLLHPTNTGGQIRSLGTLKQLHQRHEVHFATMQLEGQDEGVPRVSEYCSKAYFVPHRLPARSSLAFVPQFVGNFFSDLPLTVQRDVLPPMRALLAELRGRKKFDAILCDFLSAAVNLSDFSDVVLFQHNVETVIWERMSEHGGTALHRRYFAGQAAKMRAFEERVCKACRHVIAVSEADAQRMRTMFGIEHVTGIPTGVDVDYFAKPEKVEGVADLVFTGSMDWLPNVDGVKWFVAEILPRVRERLPKCTLTVVGRNAGREILELAERDPRIRVTGTVPDIRPYLWGAKAAIVPLRIGGGTRLKIYEAMAASTPQVSTTIGAEGLDYSDGRDIHIADRPEDFAARCVALIENEGLRRDTAEAACRLVNERFGWRQVSMHFERILEQARR